MSDHQSGPGWWLASDGRWYPPESHPSVPAATPTQSPEETLKGCGEALSSIGCALTIIGFSVLALVLLFVLVL